MILIAIDPGKTGAIAWRTTGVSIVRFTPMPHTAAGILDVLQCLQGSDGEESLCVTEKVGKMHGNPAMISGILKLAEHYGALKMSLTAVDIPLWKEVTPQSWMQFTAPGYPKGAGSGPRKKFIHNRVCQIYPETYRFGQSTPCRIPLYAADAFGILFWAEANCTPWAQYNKGG